MALELQRRGHATSFVTGRRFENWLALRGLVRIPRTDRDGDSFHVENWVDPTRVGLQLKHLEYALGRFAPDVIVTSSLALGPYLVAETARLPLAVLGFATYLMPRASQRTGPADELAFSRHAEWLHYFNVSRRAYGLRPVSAAPPATPLLGELFLLRSVPELEGDGWLPPQVRFAGACLSVERDLALERELAGFLTQRPAQAAVVFVQQGRTFGEEGFWPRLMEALAGSDVRVICDSGRMDAVPAGLPPNVFVREHVPLASALAHCSAAIVSGSSTPALGALSAGLPTLMLPAGSGTEDVAERFESRGVCLRIPPETLSTGSLRSAIERLLGDSDLRSRARALASALARVSSFECAADWLTELAARRTPGSRAAVRPP